MIIGSVRDRFPRATLRLVGETQDREIEFVVDTGFDGELALPTLILNEVATPSTAVRQLVRMAKGSVGLAIAYEVSVDWGDGLRPVMAVGLEGTPLLGVELLAGNALHLEMQEGGEVLIEGL